MNKTVKKGDNYYNSGNWLKVRKKKEKQSARACFIRGHTYARGMYISVVVSIILAMWNFPLSATRPTRRRDALYRTRYRRYIAVLTPSHPARSAPTPTPSGLDVSGTFSST